VYDAVEGTLPLPFRPRLDEPGDVKAGMLAVEGPLILAVDDRWEEEVMGEGGAGRGPPCCGGCTLWTATAVMVRGQ